MVIYIYIYVYVGICLCASLKGGMGDLVCLIISVYNPMSKIKISIKNKTSIKKWKNERKLVKQMLLDTKHIIHLPDAILSPLIYIYTMMFNRFDLIYFFTNTKYNFKSKVKASDPRQGIHQV